MEKPYHPRTSASVDSQSVDTTSGGEQRGRDNFKNVDGRKPQYVVDSLGLLLAVLVTAADVDDARAATELFARLDGQPMGKVVRCSPTASTTTSSCTSGSRRTRRMRGTVHRAASRGV